VWLETNDEAFFAAFGAHAPDLPDCFDDVVVSSEAGAHKPAPEPFELAERRVPADDYALVGDGNAGVEGAERAGWTAHRSNGDGFDALPAALSW
jgi:putative hydrolase of the HAD superfamily